MLHDGIGGRVVPKRTQSKPKNIFKRMMIAGVLVILSLHTHVLKWSLLLEKYRGRK